MTLFHLSTSGSIVALIVLVLCAIGITFLFYRFTLPPATPRKKFLLSLLRSVALCLLLLLLFEPILQRITTTEQEPTIAILLDNSISMTVKNSGGAPQEFIQKNFSEKVLRKIGTLQPKIFSFSNGAAEVRSVDSMNFSGGETDIARAFSNIKEKISPENIQAVMLVSDGNVTSGFTPLYQAEELGIPVFTVGLGDTMEQQDILVAKVLTNNVAYAETKLPIDVVVRNTGYDNTSVIVSLNENGKLIEQKIIPLSKLQRDYTLSFSVPLTAEGMKKITASVSPLKGELTEKNNAQSVFVKVLESKMHIVLLAGAPTPDIAALRQTLNEDGHFDVRTFVQKNIHEMYEGNPSQEQLDSAECFIVVNFPSHATNASLLQLLQTQLQNKHTPFFFLGGREIDFQKLKQLQNILPFFWNSVSGNELEIFTALENASRMHILTTASGALTPLMWTQLPPVYKLQTIFDARGEADILAYSRLQNVSLNEPLLMASNINRQRSIAFVGYGIHRWRLLSAQNSVTRPFLSLFLTNAIRWLTAVEEDKPIRITPTKELFSGSEPVEFVATVSNEQLQPIDDAAIEVTVTKENFHRNFSLQPMNNGRYEGSFGNFDAGEYSFSANVKRGEIILGEDKGKFSVGEVTVEFLKTTMDKPLLEQLAYRTGGEFVLSQEYASLLAKIQMQKFEAKELTQHSEIELWHWEYVLGGIITLFAMEWFIRRRSGML